MSFRAIVGELILFENGFRKQLYKRPCSHGMTITRWCNGPGLLDTLGGFRLGCADVVDSIRAMKSEVLGNLVPLLDMHPNRIIGVIYPESAVEQSLEEI